jgi:hypothetical protein
MNNLIMRKVNVTSSFQSLVSGRLVGSVTITAAPGNASEVYFRGDDGSEVPWVPGEWHSFRSINLAQLEVKGNTGDLVTIVGGTW